MLEQNTLVGHVGARGRPGGEDCELEVGRSRRKVTKRRRAQGVA